MGGFAERPRKLKFHALFSGKFKVKGIRISFLERLRVSSNYYGKICVSQGDFTVCLLFILNF